MAGCAKAGRKKKSGQNQRYIAERRLETNKRKRIARHEKQSAPKNITPRGTARSFRRADKQQAYEDAHPEIWVAPADAVPKGWDRVEAD